MTLPVKALTPRQGGKEKWDQTAQEPVYFSSYPRVR
jgi:hypothetical protein